MLLKKLAGAVVIVIGIGCLGHWADRSFFRPTHEDRQFWANVADNGGGSAVNGPAPVATYLLLGVGSILVGSKLTKK